MSRSWRCLSLPIVVAVSLLSGCGARDSGSPADAPADGDATGPEASETADSTGGDAEAAPDTTGDSTVDAPDAEADVVGPEAGVVRVVLFTHIEDNTPAGTLGDAANRAQYMLLRGRLLEVAELARMYELPWVLQPDWKFLEAALLYEDAAATADTGGRNLLLYLRDDLDVPIDPHSHENGGYNYTDVAYLLERLEVGGSTVIGGHVWDPTLPQFQEWDRFRAPVVGLRYPDALWRGDILIGAGTPGHVHDPLVSGVWRPRDRDSFFVDDPAGNVVAVGAWHDQVAGVQELIDLYADGTVEPGALLTASWNITPSTILAPDGLAQIEDSVFAPIDRMRDDGLVLPTDFTTLVAAWRTAYGGASSLYQP